MSSRDIQKPERMELYSSEILIVLGIYIIPLQTVICHISHVGKAQYLACMLVVDGALTDVHLIHCKHNQPLPWLTYSRHLEKFPFSCRREPNYCGIIVGVVT